MTSTTKARVSSVEIAGRTIECLMLPSGEFRIAFTQIAETLGISARHRNNARNLKALLGEDIPRVKVKSELNSNPVSTITLKEFEMLLIKLVAKGNEVATEMSLRLAGASLTAIVSHAFGIKYDQERIVSYVASRDEHRRNFRQRLTDYWKTDGLTEPIQYAKRVNQFKLACGLPLDTINDNVVYTDEQLKVLNEKEIIYCAFRKAGFEHDKAIALM